MKKRALVLTSLVVLMAILAGCGGSYESARPEAMAIVVVEQAMATGYDQASSSPAGQPKGDQTDRMIIWTADIADRQGH